MTDTRRSVGHRPNAVELFLAQRLLAPWSFLTAPVFHGLEGIPRDRPVLFVGNHTVWGVLDVPVMAMALQRKCGITTRFLGDHLHYAVPLWRDLLTRLGVVDGTRENCCALMCSGESVLVFPGGGREVMKRRGEKYRLLWKQRVGFARLAIQHGYPIVPFSAVGAEECFEILIDGNDVMRTPLRHLIERMSSRPDMIPPLVRGIGLSILPRPQRFYFRFGEPIETRHLAGRHDHEDVCFAVREEARAAVERGIDFLIDERGRDPERALLPRLVRQLWRLSGAEAGRWGIGTRHR
jgi:1-acyl-sn-glycerol-3-phosphate acyltransferase